MQHETSPRALPGGPTRAGAVARDARRAGVEAAPTRGQAAPGQAVASQPVRGRAVRSQPVASQPVRGRAGARTCAAPRVGARRSRVERRRVAVPRPGPVAPTVRVRGAAGPRRARAATLAARPVVRAARVARAGAPDRPASGPARVVPVGVPMDAGPAVAAGPRRVGADRHLDPRRSPKPATGAVVRAGVVVPMRVPGVDAAVRPRARTSELLATPTIEIRRAVESNIRARAIAGATRRTPRRPRRRLDPRSAR
jgi:hypothetical protein